LGKNMLAVLESIPLKSMYKFANHSHRFMNSYMHGLNGRQVAWAAIHYETHMVEKLSHISYL
ncbi:hypothetical protein L208DRAFT_1282952, partial [Tricholoma matsutake]